MSELKFVSGVHLLRQPDWSPREWFAFGIMISILGMTGLVVGAYMIRLNGPCDNPGCNVPETLWIDHYTIQNGSTGQPSLLTIWFGSSGRYGQAVDLRSLSLSFYSDSHQFSISGKIAANSVVPLSVDTSTDGFYFVHQQCYVLTLVTDPYIITFGDQICS